MSRDMTHSLLMWELIFCLIHYVQTPENTSPTTYLYHTHAHYIPYTCTLYTIHIHTIYHTHTHYVLLLSMVVPPSWVGYS